MTRRIGFALVSLAIVGTILAVTNAESYMPGGPLAFQLRESTVFTIWREVTSEPVSLFDQFQREQAGQLTPPAQREIAFRLTLGNAVAFFAGVALLGAGLLLFGGRRE